jgi:hypothetical protein
MTKAGRSERSKEEFIGVRELNECVGKLMYFWSGVEQALNKSVDDLSVGASEVRVNGFANTLARWKALHQDRAGERPEHMKIIEAVFSRLSEASKLRNCISHGQKGLHGSEVGDNDEAHISTELNGETREISYAELMVTVEYLDGVRRSMDDITYCAEQPNDTCLDGMYTDIRIRVEGS